MAAPRELRDAMDLKDAAAHGAFEAHLRAPDVAALLEVEGNLEGQFYSPRPEHDRLEKLLTMQDSIKRCAHVEATPEDIMWRGELEAGVEAAEQA